MFSVSEPNKLPNSTNKIDKYELESHKLFISDSILSIKKYLISLA